MSHGYWIITTVSEELDYMEAECSFCRELITSDAFCFYKYCPNCGAKMDCQDEYFSRMQNLIDYWKDPLHTSVFDDNEKGAEYADETDKYLKELCDRSLDHNRLYDKLFPDEFWKMLRFRLKEMELSRSVIMKEDAQNGVAKVRQGL